LEVPINRMEDKAVASDAKTGLALESYEMPTKLEAHLVILNMAHVEKTLDEEIAKLLEMQTQVIDKIKNILNGKNGEIRTTEDSKNE
jgi:hypothetical protein